MGGHFLSLLLLRLRRQLRIGFFLPGTDLNDRLPGSNLIIGTLEGDIDPIHYTTVITAEKCMDGITGKVPVRRLLSVLSTVHAVAIQTAPVYLFVIQILNVVRSEQDAFVEFVVTVYDGVLKAVIFIDFLEYDGGQFAVVLRTVMGELVRILVDVLRSVRETNLFSLR